MQQSANQRLINDVMLPFLNNLQYQRIMIIAFNIDGYIIYANKLTQDKRKEPTNLLGKHLLELPGHHPEVLNQSEKIRREVIKTKYIIKYMHITDNLNFEQYVEFAVFTEQHIPFFNTNHEVIASYIIGTPIIPLNIENILFTPRTKLKKPKVQIKLSDRQHEILFLLCYNISQNHIAKYLGISRSTVSKIIFEQLLHKFQKITNIDELINAAIQNGINFNFPSKLMQPKIFIVDFDI